MHSFIKHFKFLLYYRYYASNCAFLSIGMNKKAWPPDALMLFSSQVVQTPFNPMDCSMPGFLVLHYLLEFTWTHIHWVSDAIQLSHPLSPSSPPALNHSHHQIFSSELALCIRWPKYWSFNFSISPFNEYSALVFLRLTGLISLPSKRLSRLFSSITVWKHQFFGSQPSL